MILPLQALFLYFISGSKDGNISSSEEKNGDYSSSDDSDIVESSDTEPYYHSDAIVTGGKSLYPKTPTPVCY